MLVDCLFSSKKSTISIKEGSLVRTSVTAELRPTTEGPQAVQFAQALDLLRAQHGSSLQQFPSPQKQQTWFRSVQ